jgi:putative membrane protein
MATVRRGTHRSRVVVANVRLIMTPKVKLPQFRAPSTGSDRAPIRSRIAALCATPVAMLLAVLLPTLAAGVFWVAQTDQDATTGTVTVRSTAGGSATDPLAPSRSALTNTALPLQILAGGMTELTDGSTELDDGAHQMSDGLHQARDGSAELADGMTQLRAGLWQLGDGSSQVSGGVDRVVGALTGVGAAQGQIELIVQQTLDSLAASGDPQAAASADQLRPVLDLLRTQGLNGGVLTDLETLRKGAQTVAYQLDDPKSEFVDGMVRATDGSAQLRDGLVLLDDGGVRLVDGTTRLVGGVGPMETMFSTLRSNVEKASTSLPAATQVEADSAGSTNSYVVRSASDNWPYLAAAFALVAAALVGFFVPRVRAAVLGAVATSITMVLALAFADTGASFSGSVTATVLIVLWVAATVAAARAIRTALGLTVGGIVLAVLGIAQIVLAGMVLRGAGGAVDTVSMFTPIGQLVRILGASVDGGSLVFVLVSTVAAVVTLAVSVAVLLAHGAAREPDETADASDPDDSSADDDRFADDTVASSVP